MTKILGQSTCPAVLTVAILAVSLAGLGPAFAADPLTEEQIVQALKPAMSRSLTLSHADTAGAADKKLLDSVRNRTAHSLTADEREQIALAAAAKPSIDIDINFDFRSARIGGSAASAVNTLGKALSSPGLKGTTFVLAGHTDGKGGLAYNQELSEKRVDTVKRYLVSRFKLSAANLVAVGYGKTRLKNERDPLSSENRRVQIVNMAANN